MTLLKSKYKWISNCFKVGKDKISDKLNTIFSCNKVDQDTIEELEELLITSDIGVKVATDLTSKISAMKLGKDVSVDEVKQILTDEIIKIIEPVAQPIKFNTTSPHVMLFCGLNGNGKTTAIGKLAYKYSQIGKSVLIVACDTFRAAANEQLEIWAEYSKCKIVKGEENSDPASVAYKAMEQAKQENIDVVLVDTSGRIHTYKNFMEELAKIIRIIKKHDEDSPHNIILVLDATTGQNALSQVRVFRDMVQINGLILTKFDGTSKGGVIVGLAKQYPEILVHYIGVGEGVEDIEEFSPKAFVDAMLNGE